jgi:hypothetical protein
MRLRIKHVRTNLNDKWLFTGGRLEDFSQFVGVEELGTWYGTCLIGEGGWRRQQNRCHRRSGADDPSVFDRGFHDGSLVAFIIRK